MLYGWVEDYDNAIKEMEKVLELEPGDDDALSQLDILKRLND